MFAFKSLRNTSAFEPLDDGNNNNNSHQRLVVPPPSTTTHVLSPPTKGETTHKQRLSSGTIPTVASCDDASIYSNAKSSVCSASNKSAASFASMSSSSRRARKKQQQQVDSNKIELLSNKMGTKQEKQLLKMVKSLPNKARDDLALQATTNMKIRRSINNNDHH